MPILRTRVLSRFRLPRRRFRLPGPVSRHPYAFFHSLNLLLFVALLATVPRTWIGGQSERYWSDWRLRTPARVHVVLNAWNEFHLPPFRRLDDPGLLAFLQAHPLIAALGSADGKTLVVRDGDRWRPAGSAEGDRSLARWMGSAIRANEDGWNPMPEEDPDYDREILIVCRSGPWFVLIRWTIGSPEVERFLRQRLGPHATFRVGIQRARFEERPEASAPAWSRAPNLQAECPRIIDPVHIVVLDGTNIPYFRDWNFVFLPSWGHLQDYQHRLLRWRLSAFGLCLLVPGLIALGAALHHYLRRRERLEMDRMASMTHSLKTPLGVLKLRCDSIRLGQFDPVQTEVELLRISKEVDQLTAFINQSLQGFRKQGTPSRRDPVPPTWFRDLAEEFQPIFGLEDRTLHLDLDPAGALAHPPTLKVAVATLLENALAYGSGPVLFATRLQGRCLQIRIKNEGRGLDPFQLEELGKPFTRFRTQDAEGFQTAGLGLGLFQLVSTAQREGWGLRLLSRPGHGVLAVLEVQAAPPRARPS